MLKVHQILSIVIILPLFLVGTFHYSFVSINFQLNREYITQQFCINKDKPELACGGQCHFMKQMADLKEADEERTGDQETSQDERPTNLFFASPLSDYINTSSIKLNYPVVSNTINDGFIQLVKAPPQA